ncbi:hypothetical protein PP1Y_AT32618 [Novosphingobium sp. PP1Y]|nr:hypothetical protein PP1Y_AT32618 [Novosphingobium sp. PP1Y]
MVHISGFANSDYYRFINENVTDIIIPAPTGFAASTREVLAAIT